MKGSQSTMSPEKGFQAKGIISCNWKEVKKWYSMNITPQKTALYTLIQKKRRGMK